MKIAHISDLHILKVKGKVTDFLNKRLIGGLNIYFNRKGEYLVENVEKLFNDLNKENPDHIVITGDFTNLALPSEYEKAKELLELLGESKKISIIPGNHDNYTRGAEKKRLFEKYFAKWIITDIETKNKFPYVRLLDDNIAIIGFYTSIHSCPLCSAGKISKAQIKQFKELMENPKLKDRYKIVLIHQHLLKKSKRDEWVSGMRERTKIVKLFSDYKIDLVLHGHRHVNSRYIVNEYDYDLEVQEAGASARYTQDNKGNYSIYEIKDNSIINKRVKILDFETKKYIEKK